MPMKPNGAFPNWLSNEYPGLEGISTGLQGFKELLNNPGYKQLAESQAADPAAQGYQAASDSGLPSSAAPGLFGRLVAGQMGANVAGQASQDAGQNAAQKGRIGATSDASSLMVGQQSSQTELEKAQAKQALQQLGGFKSILDMATDPKGMGANIMGLFTGKNTDSPLGSLFSGIKSLFGSSLYGGSVDPLAEAVAGSVAAG
jgi:hypothetical protein